MREKKIQLEKLEKVGYHRKNEMLVNFVTRCWPCRRNNEPITSRIVRGSSTFICGIEMFQPNLLRLSAHCTTRKQESEKADWSSTLWHM